MTDPYLEEKTIAFKDDPFLLGLTDVGRPYEGCSADATIAVAARVGQTGDWAAYYQNPYWGPKRVATLGDKLPEEAARRLFPNELWATLRYRS